MFVLNFTDEYDYMTLTNFTNKENKFDRILPELLLTKPCGLSF